MVVQRSLLVVLLELVLWRLEQEESLLRVPELMSVQLCRPRPECPLSERQNRHALPRLQQQQRPPAE